MAWHGTWSAGIVSGRAWLAQTGSGGAAGAPSLGSYVTGRGVVRVRMPPIECGINGMDLTGAALMSD
jgi:hypothetical protein